MNLIFVVLNASLGGHTRTAVATAQALRERGHKIRFIVSKNANPKTIEAADFTFSKVTRDWFGRFLPIENLLKELNNEENIDCIHSFEINLGILETAVAARNLNIPFCWTICGGPPKTEIHGLRKIVSLTREIQEALHKKHMDTEVEYMPARLNCQELDSFKNNTKDKAFSHFSSRYGIPEDAFVLMRIARQSSAYVPGIRNGMFASANLYQAGKRIYFIHIGFRYSNNAHNEIKESLENVSQKTKRTIAFSLEEEAENAIQYLNRAQATIAAGRSAFESMFFGIPTIISATNGGVRLIDPESIEELLYYNFSGRNLPKMNPAESQKELERILHDLIESPQKTKELGDFCHEFAIKHLDHKIAGQFYEQYYRELNVSDLSSIDEQALYQNYLKKLFLTLPLNWREKVFSFKKSYRNNLYNELKP